MNTILNLCVSVCACVCVYMCVSVYMSVYFPVSLQHHLQCCPYLYPGGCVVYWWGLPTYKCAHNTGLILSPDAVPSPAVPVLSMSLPRLLCSLLVGSPYLLVTIILLVKYCRSRAQGETREPRKTRQDQLGDHVEEE
uniref:Uncharacterized protein n=1 Tax=Salmo trutta TaxID=8032 RepID=A0A673WCK5_SALTR